MDQQVMISVIMPVYAVEDYVAKAIESVQAQTYSNWELLAVDDGSEDRGGEICDAYAARDSRITVYHKENGGAPSARNYAMDRASGKYYYFMDSDDWIEPTMFEDLLQLAEVHQAELVISGFYIDTYHSDTEFVTEEKVYKDVVYEDQQAFREDAHNLFENNLLYTPWNKLYLRSWIESQNIRFRQTFWDDFPFVLEVIRDVNQVVVTANKYYHFIRKREESETTRYREGVFEKREEEHEWLLELYDHWSVHSAEARDMLALRYLERLIGCIENVACDDCKLPRREKLNEIRRMIDTERAEKALAYVKPRSFYLKLMFKPIAWKHAWLAYLEGRFISAVKKRNVKLFARLKAAR